MIECGELEQECYISLLLPQQTVHQAEQETAEEQQAADSLESEEGLMEEYSYEDVEEYDHN